MANENFKELLTTLIKAFKAESDEKASDWDGAIFGSLNAAYHYYGTRKKAFEDVSGLKMAREEAEKATVVAKNEQVKAQEEQVKAQEEQAKAKHTKEDAETAIAKLKAAKV